MLTTIMRRRCAVAMASVMAFAATITAAEPPAFVESMALPATAVGSIAVSPDGRHLYGVSLIGQILRWPLDGATGALSAPQVLTLPHFQTEAGPRGLIGLAFDPDDPDVLWVSDNNPVFLSGKHPDIPDFTGRISRVVIAPGDAFSASATAYVSGLPRSCSDHLTNSLAFHPNPDAARGGPEHFLYVSQGSTSSMGEADANWCMRPERLMSAAVLEVDTTRVAPEGGFDVTTEPLPTDGESRRFGYTRVLRGFIWPSDDGDLKNGGIEIDDGEHAGRWLHFDAQGVASVREGAAQDSAVTRRYYDPFAPDAPVRLFATGVRNGYDLVWHSNGSLYVAANGGSGNANAPDDPSTPVNEAVSGVARQPDLLYRLERGDIGGHANPLLDAFIAFGANPTAGEDPFEIVEYPVGTLPDPRLRTDRIHTLGFHYAPTGTVEYPDGTLIIAQYFRDGTLRAIQFDDAGAVRGDDVLRTPAGEPIAYENPIDIAVDAAGRLYVATLPRSNGRGRILRLDPVSVERAESPAKAATP